jgi:8-oxo-dGTP diphosphatase
VAESSGSGGQRQEVQVAAGILVAPDGRVLLGRRPAGKVYAGYWEFPGGKVEPGESMRLALDRELREELGIEVIAADPWITRHFIYPHADVHIRFFRVCAWAGEPHAVEHDGLAWQLPGEFDLEPMLPANSPVLQSLVLPDEYAISDASSMGFDAFLAVLEARLAGGLRLLQLREPAMDAERWAAFAPAVIERCRAVGARVLVNGGAPAAVRAQADGIHLRSADLMALTTRPDAALLAASCHDAAQLAHAAHIGVDFAVLGPVAPTRSHPGESGMGWAAFEALVRDLPMPVYAIGGMRPVDLQRARGSGAQGLAMISAAWMRR